MRWIVGATVILFVWNAYRLGPIVQEVQADPPKYRFKMGPPATAADYAAFHRRELILMICFIPLPLTILGSLLAQGVRELRIPSRPPWERNEP